MSLFAETPPAGALAACPVGGPVEPTAQESELFRVAFERSAAGMAHLSTAGFFLRVNAKLCEMTGYSSAELTGMHFTEITLEGDYGPADEARRLRLATIGGSYSVERRYVRKNGEIFWVSIATTMLPDGNGVAKYGMSVIEDITERKRAELRLQRLNRLHGMVSNISAGAAHAQDRRALFALACTIAIQRGGFCLSLIVEIDQASGALRSVAARDGGGGGEQAGEGLDAAVGASGALAAAVRSGQRAVCAIGAGEAGQAWHGLVARNGIDAAACFPLFSGGVATGALILAATEAGYFEHDELDLLMTAANCLTVTTESMEAERQRRLAEEKVRRQESLLASAEHVAGIGRWERDLANERLEWSDETLRIFGLERGSFGATSAALLERVHPDDRQALSDKLDGKTASADGALEYRIVRPDGEERVILDSGAALVDEDGRITRRAGVVIDITERRRAEVQQRRHAERLAALVQAQRVLAHSDATIEQLFDQVPALALGVGHADGAVLELVDGDSMVCRALTASHIEVLGMRYPLADSLSGEAISSNRTLCCDDTENDPRVARALCRKFGLRSVLATVVSDGHRAIGVLKLFGYATAQFGTAESDSLEILAEALGAVIRRKNAEEDARLSLQIQAGIVGIQQEMASSQWGMQGAMERIVAGACQLTAATGSAVVLVDGKDLVHRAASGALTGRRDLRFPRAASLVGLAIERQESLCCNDAATDARVNPELMNEVGARSMIAAPLRVGNAVVGALIVVFDRANVLTGRELATTQILAQWLGVVMQSAVAAEHLRRSEAQYRLAFAANPLPMWVYDTQTLRFLAVNDAATLKYGYSSAEFLAMTIRDIRPFEGAPMLDAHLAGSRGHAAIASVWQHRTRDGLLLDAEISSNAMTFGDRPARLVLAHDITVRRNAERQVERSKSILKIAGRVAQVAGWSFDLAEQKFEYSDELCALHELPAASAISHKQAIAFYAPESQAAIREAANACARDGTPYDLELEIVTARGRRIAVRTIGQAVRDAAGTVVGTQGAVQDISEKNQAAAQIVALASRLTTTLDSITDAFYTLDADWRFTYVNGEAERLLKRSREELIGHGIWETFPLAGSEMDRQFRAAVLERKSVNFETFFAHQRLWIEVHAYPSENGLAVYGRDVSERHRGQEQLRLLETCVAHMNDVVVISELGPEDVPKVVFVNDAFVRFTGFSRDEAIGQTPGLLHGPRTDRDEVRRVRQLLRLGEPARAELILYRKDGSTYWVELEVVPIRYAGGSVSHWIGVQRDTTERRRHEQALRSLNETLESRVIERTAALELARHDAEQASRAKSAFVATMSHEIRTPMNGVIGMIDVLQQTELAADQSKMLDLARDSAHSLMAIIEDILDFSKIEAGKVELEREHMSIPGIVEKVCAMLAGGAHSQGARIGARVDPALAQAVWGDAVRVRQVLVNLVNNAIKFSGHSSGGGRVDVRATRRASGPGSVTVELVVEDNGIGMDAGDDQPALPTVRAGRRVDDAALRRHRSRPDDHQAPRRADGRNHRRQQHPGHRLEVHRDAAARHRFGAHGRAARRPAVEAGRRGSADRGRRPSRADPGRRGQRDQSEGDHRAAQAARLRGRDCGQRQRRARALAKRPLCLAAHRPADAGDGRLRPRGKRPARRRCVAADPDHRPDRERPERGIGALHRGRHGLLPDEAGPAGDARDHDPALPGRDEGSLSAGPDGLGPRGLVRRRPEGCGDRLSAIQRPSPPSAGRKTSRPCALAHSATLASCLESQRMSVVDLMRMRLARATELGVPSRAFLRHEFDQCHALKCHVNCRVAQAGQEIEDAVRLLEARHSTAGRCRLGSSSPTNASSDAHRSTFWRRTSTPSCTQHGPTGSSR